ncbi:uncharacterized protein LOC126755670 [Bactrocera neohumeralis]|uniref:uncharacterized protein LOC120772389 n=1 Tax=Bactrocera tryoni TaxID=59916 RepID=UPI001A96F77A|nr:uncharacterized protein LOC120772389 [Bactrocera tryoni]XP_050324360.1 uncharacterized protein LOC126755670 [Bactrocera neohumeralis]
MRIIPSVFVLFAVIGVAYSASSVWGTANSTDAVIYQKNIVHPGVPNVVQTFFFSIPDSYQSNSRVISSIRLDDEFKNTTGPTNTLISGGPSWTFGIVQMVTQRSYGLNVTVVVYGKYVL